MARNNCPHCDSAYTLCPGHPELNTPQPAEGDGAVGEVLDMKYNVALFYPRGERPYLQPGTKLYTRPAAAAVVPEGWVLVPRAAALVAAAVADEWAAMFADISGLEKYDRFQYGPAVEQMRDDMLAAAPAAPKGVDGVEQLTEQQAVIVTGYTGTLCGSFGAFHADLEKRAGRSVFTHEMSDFGWIKSLYRDDFIALAGQHGGPHDGR